jgi:uncharacterized ion transporter superfamily protein YfcC
MVASWGLAITSISNGEFVTQDANKIGIFTLTSYFMVAVEYFFNISLFVLAIGGFYGVLHKIPQYRLLLDKIVHGFRNLEWLYMIIVGFVIAILSSMAGFSLPVLILFPFVVSTLLLMGYNKVTAAMLTIGSTVAGLIGTVFSYGETYGVTLVLGVKCNENVLWKLVFLGVALAIVLINTIIYGKRHKNEEEAIDSYLVPEKVKTDNKRVFPLVFIFDSIIILLVLAFISWDVFNIDVFKNITSYMANPSGNWFSKGFFTVLNTVLGVTEGMPFGNWSLTEVSLVLLLGSGLIAFAYRKSLNNFLSDFANGAKKAVYPALLVVLAYTVLVCITNSPFILTILRPILNLEGEANVFIMCIVALVFSIFTVEPYYGITSAAAYVLAVKNESNIVMISLAWQSMYGIAMLFVPTSVVLMATLSYLGISYGKWMKAIWSLILEMLVAFVVLLFIV